MAQASPADGPSFESSELGMCYANYHGYAQRDFLGRGRHPGDCEGSPARRRFGRPLNMCTRTTRRFTNSALCERVIVLTTTDRLYVT